MFKFFKRYSRYFYLIFLILLSWAGIRMYLNHFSYGNEDKELRKKYIDVLQNQDRLSVMSVLKQIYESAKSNNDKKLYIESYIQYYLNRSNLGFKQDASSALFYLLDTEANYLQPDQLFNIYNMILSASLDPYYFREKVELQLKQSVITEMKQIIDTENEPKKKLAYLISFYGMNINRRDEELLSLEKAILQYAPDLSKVQKVIHYRKALKYRANKFYLKELQFMKLASIGGEPGVGELGVTYRNNNMLDSAEVEFLKVFLPNHASKMEHYFFPCINLAKLYIKKQDYKKAAIFLKQAENFGKLYLGEFYLSEIYEIKTNLYKTQNLKELTIEALEDEKELIISQYSKFYLTNKANAFVINEVRSIRNSRNYLIVTFFCVIAGTILFFYLYICSMLKKYRMSLHEKEMERKKSSELKQELNDAFNKFSELSHISEKKDKVIDSIMSNKDIKKALSHKDILLLNELKSFTNTGNEWSLVKNNFHIHFPEFYTKLMKINPSLTELELRYATYIKMGLTNAEIATLLNINVQSVATFKYRLKNRLNLDKDQSLLEFMINF